MAAKVPEGFHTITPYLVSREPRKLVEFLEKGLGATITTPGRSEGEFHGELKIGNSILMIGSSGPAMPPYAAQLYLYVDDVDGLYKRALSAGAASSEEPSDRPWGDRMAAVMDPSGNRWMLAANKENRRR